MGAVVVVSVQPVGRHVTHFLQAAEDVAVEHLGWVGLVESFDIGVLRGLPPNRRSDRVSTAWRSPPLLRTGVKRSLHARSTAADTLLEHALGPRCVGQAHDLVSAHRLRSGTVASEKRHSRCSTSDLSGLGPMPKPVTANASFDRSSTTGLWRPRTNPTQAVSVQSTKHQNIRSAWIEADHHAGLFFNKSIRNTGTGSGLTPITARR